jgi:hypothetical protein
VNTLTTLRAGRSRVPIPAGGIGFSLLQKSRPVLGPIKPPTPRVSRLFPGSTPAGAPPFRVDVRKVRSHTCSHPYTPSQRRLLLTNLFLCSFICVRIYVYTYVGYLLSFIYSFIYRYIHSFIHSQEIFTLNQDHVLQIVKVLSTLGGSNARALNTAIKRNMPVSTKLSIIA